MNRFEKLSLASILLGAVALTPGKTKADDPQITATYYAIVEDGTSDGASSDFPGTGSTFVQVAQLYTTANRTGTPVGAMYTSCNQLLGVLDVMCTSTVRYNNGSDSFNVVGYYTELLTPPNCPPSTISQAISGGTGAYQGAWGQVLTTHTPLNPDAQCNHTEHGYKFEVSLHTPGGDD
jgi:hypothetical protein